MMRWSVALVLLCLLVGCNNSQRIDRSALDQRYQDTQLAQGTLSIVPMRLSPDEDPPVVVNWWYAGTRDGEHVLVYRSLTWDRDLKPIGQEQRYRVSQNDLKIIEPIAYTKDAGRWLRLHDAAAGEIAPPADLPTARVAPTPTEQSPIRLPDPSTVEPATP